VGCVSNEAELPTEALTQESLVLGTIPYISPEQLEGRQVDHRSGVFSVGIVLHEIDSSLRRPPCPKGLESP
jgi:serine/threonine protein kinase